MTNVPLQNTQRETAGCCHSGRCIEFWVGSCVMLVSDLHWNPLARPKATAECCPATNMMHSNHRKDSHLSSLHHFKQHMKREKSCVTIKMKEGTIPQTLETEAVKWSSKICICEGGGATKAGSPPLNQNGEHHASPRLSIRMWWNACADGSQAGGKPDGVHHHPLFSC